MGRINVVISNEIERKSKKEIFKRYGMRKGNLSLIIEEAINLWMESVRAQITFIPRATIIKKGKLSKLVVL